VYINKSTQAVAAFHSRDFRESANKYLEAFEASPSKWAENRWQIFRGYTSILQEEYFAASQIDFEALQKVVNDKSEVKLYRCEAAFTSGLLSWIAKNREEAAAFYRDAIRLATKAAEKERKRKVMATIATPDGNATAGLGLRLVGEIIDEIKEQANGNLENLENFTVQRNRYPLPTPKQRMRSDGTPMPRAFRQTKISQGPLGTTLTREQAGLMLSVGGESCDHCKKTRKELGLKHLKACSRCKRAYYCSEDCQKEQWRAGHKEYCRKPGEIKPGDYCRLNGIQSRPEINGEVVEVTGADPRQEGRWEVRIPGGDRSISIASEKMEQLRPLK